MAKLALVSDVHLGTRQYGLKVRSNDFCSAFWDVAHKVIEAKPDAMIIGGDLFDSSRPDAYSVLSAKEAVEQVKANGIKVFGIDGNHDVADGNWLRVIGATPLDIYDHVAFGDKRLRGVAYRNGRDLIAALQALADAGERADILVMHFALHEMNGGGSADTGVQELSPILDKLGTKCVLMGHVHIPEVRPFNGVLYVNPGATEMKSVSEPRDKFFFLVDTSDWSYQEVPVKTRKIVDMEIVSEEKLLDFQKRLKDEQGLPEDDKPMYNVLADAEMEEVFKRITQSVKETDAIARIVVCTRRDRDVAPMVDRKEGMATLESAIEARFPADSQEARLVSDFLRSSENAAIHMRVERFMKED